jgi:hypothetical protein
MRNTKRFTIKGPLAALIGVGIAAASLFVPQAASAAETYHLAGPYSNVSLCNSDRAISARYYKTLSCRYINVSGTPAGYYYYWITGSI